MPKMADLKPCPFCGFTDINFDYKYFHKSRCAVDFLVYLECQCCGAKTRSQFAASEDEESVTAAEARAINAWNRRAEDGRLSKPLP